MTDPAAEIPTSGILAKRVADALHMMFEGPVHIVDGHLPDIPKLSNGRVVVVPIVGDPTYLVTLQANVPGSVALASAMFSCAKKLTTQAMIDDAMCELASMVAGQIRSLMARDHQVGTPSMVDSDGNLAGAERVVSARLTIGDADSLIDAMVANFDTPQTSSEEVPRETIGPTIMIAEDDEVTLQFVKAAVEDAAMTVVSEARNGTQALSDFRRLRPDVSCLDINMPELTGLQVLAAIRKDAPDAIVFLVSSFATVENVREAIHLKASGIIVKPFIKARIVTEIERALALRKQQ